MAVTYNGLFGSNQSKTAGTSLAINPADITVATGDDIFVGWAGDVGGSAFGVTDGGTATISWTEERVQTQGSDVEVRLWRGNVTAGGSLTDLTIAWTTNLTAKAAVAGWFSGVGTQDANYGGDDIGGNSVAATIAGTWQIDDLAIAACGIEGAQDAETVTAGAFSDGGGTMVGQNGTTGGGAAANIVAALGYQVTTTNRSASAAIGFTFTNTRDASAAGAVYSPAAAATPVPRHPAINHQNPGLLAKAHDAWERTKGGIFVPRLWTPEGAQI